MLQRFRPNSVRPNIGNDNLDKVFQNFFGSFMSPATSLWTYDPFAKDSYSQGFAPVDIKEDDDNITVTVDLPGIDSKAIKVEVDRNILRIEAALEEAEESDSDGYVVRERQVGSLRRSINLGKDVDIDSATSTHKDGVLEIVLPKTSKSQVKQITVNS